MSGCGTTLVIDGNMKHHREVCLAQEAGYVEFNGLPGKVKTGCPNTPQLKSRYCPLHTPTAFKLQGLNPVDIDSTHACASEHTNNDSGKEHQFASIVGKKTTRHTTFYQVSN